MTLARPTGSAELDRILAERARIREAWRRPRPALQLAPPSHELLPLPRLYYLQKTVDERVAEADEFRGKLPERILNEIRSDIRDSAKDFGEPCSLDIPRACEAEPEIPGRFCPTVRKIQEVTADYFGITRDQMLSRRRNSEWITPRQIAMYLSKVMTARSLPDIGRRFDGRDHTTILHAFRKMGRMIAKDAELAEEIATLREMLLK